MFTFSVPTIVLSNEASYANIAAFLASDQASYVSGAVYNIARG